MLVGCARPVLASGCGADQILPGGLPVVRGRRRRLRQGRDSVSGYQGWAALWCVVCLLSVGLALAESARALPVAPSRDELTLWAMGAEGRLIRELADAFERENPGVRVKTQAISWDGAHEKLLTATIGRMTPDLCQLGTTWMPELHAMKALLPLDDLLASSALTASDFFSANWQTNVFDNKCYGIPWYVDVRVFFYRTDLASAVGYPHFARTWDEFRDLGRRQVERQRRLGQPGYFWWPGLNDWQVMLVHYWQAGGDLLTDDRVLDEAAYREALEHLRGLFTEGLTHLTDGAGRDWMEMFRTGFYPVIFSGGWMVADIDQACPDLAGRWTTAPLPRHRRGTSFVGGSNLVIFRDSPRAALAFRFLEFAARPDVQARWFEVSRDLPARRAAWDDPRLAASPHLKAFRQQLDDAATPPQIPEWEAVAQVISEQMEPVLRGHTSPASATRRTAAEIGALLHRSRSRQGTGWRWSVAAVVVGLPVLAAFLWVYSDIRRAGRSVGPLPVGTGSIPAASPVAGRFADGHGSSRPAGASGHDGPGAIVTAPPASVLAGTRPPPDRRAWLFLLPALVLLIVFRAVPTLGSVVASLTNWDVFAIGDPDRVQLVGLANYQRLVGDEVFWISLRNTFVFVLLGVPLNLALAVGLASLISRAGRGWLPWLRFGFFLPSVTTVAAVALVFNWLYNPERGLFNQLLGYLGVGPVPWLADRWFALPSLVLMSSWKGLGYNLIIVLAAIQNIPRDFYESLEIDGGDWWHEIRYITIPMLHRTLFLIGVSTTVSYLHYFTEPYLMTGGGPLHSTSTVVLYLYQRGFKFFDLGYASAMTCVLCLLVAAFNLTQRALRQQLSA